MNPESIHMSIFMNTKKYNEVFFFWGITKKYNEEILRRKFKE